MMKKAVVPLPVVQASLPGLPIKHKMC